MLKENHLHQERERERERESEPLPPLTAGAGWLYVAALPRAGWDKPTRLPLACILSTLPLPLLTSPNVTSTNTPYPPTPRIRSFLASTFVISCPMYMATFHLLPLSLYNTWNMISGHFWDGSPKAGAEISNVSSKIYYGDYTLKTDIFTFFFVDCAGDLHACIG